jgi:hypothetical protein
VAVDVSTQAAGDGTHEPGQVLSVTVAANADDSAVVEMIEQADRTAPISNRLRIGSPVRLTEASVLRHP